MKKLSALAAALIAVAGWVQAAYWRERSDWVSAADIDQLRVDVIADVVDEPDPEPVDCHADEAVVQVGCASVHVVRAVDPPHPQQPWFFTVAHTTFDVDEETGLRVIHTDEGWHASKAEATQAACAAATHLPRLDDVPEF